MIAVNEQFFLRCLTDYLHAIPTIEIPSEADWNELFALARSQSLDALIYRQCIVMLPKETKRKQLKPYAAQATISVRRQEELEQLNEYLKEQDISVIFMKGSVFREYYSVPGLRSMGDIDCIVREKDRDAADTILREKMGYQRFIDNHAVWTYWKENVYFEIHTHMFYEHLANDVDYTEYFDHIWEHCHRAPVFEIESDGFLVPEENFHFLYLMAHTAKHVTNKGSGFRPYLDMVLMVRCCAERLDWEWIKKELERLRLLKFTEICFALCERWFEVEMPLSDMEIEDEFFKKATRKTFDDGVFGLLNTDNEAASSAKELKRSRLPRPLTAALLTGKKLFPPYRDMQLIPWYSFVDGKPWLMPYAWVYRWFYCLRNKKEKGFELLTEPYVKEEIIAAREEWLKQWGL